MHRPAAGCRGGERAAVSTMPPMRNAALPLLATFVLVAAVIGLLLNQTRVQPGQGGPELSPGILSLAKKERQRVASAPLADAVTTVTGAEADPNATPWRVVVLAAGDQHPLTRALVLGLGEQLFNRNVIPVIVPEDTRPTLFTLPADRVLTVRQRSGEPAQLPGAALTCMLDVVETVPRLPADHPGAGLQAGAPFAARSWTVEHRDGGSRGASWATWYAGLGRHLADAVLAKVAGPAQTGPQPFAGWTAADGPLIEPPQADAKAFGTTRINVLAWSAAFQTALVRGWVGVIASPTFRQTDGTEIPGLAVLEDRMRRGGWTEQPQALEQTAHPKAIDRVWTKTIAGRGGPDLAPGTPVPDQAWAVSARSHGTGWLVCAWQERPGAAALYQQWATAARAGDAAALARVKAHADCARIPADLRAEWK